MIKRRQFIQSMAAIAISAPTARLLARSFILPTIATGRADWQCRVIETTPRKDSDQTPVVTGVAIQPTGRWLAVVGDDHVVSLLDLNRLEFTGHFLRHQDWVRAATFTPDGEALLTAGNDGRILVWTISSIGQERELARHDAAVFSIDVSRDGKRVAAAGFEKLVRIYDLRDGNVEQELDGPCNDIDAVAFSADDQYLAAGGRNGVTRVWEAATGKTVVDFRAQRTRIRSLEFTPDGRVAGCGNDCDVTLTDPKSPNASRTLPRHGGKLFAVKMMDGGQLATSGSDNCIHIWDIETLKKIDQLNGHTGTVSCLDYHAGMLVSGSYDTQVRIWQSQRQASLSADSTTGSDWKRPSRVR